MHGASTEQDWTPGTIAALRELWSEGHSTAEIGRRMGFSKNAVVGKARRLHLPARPSPIRTAGSGTPRRGPRPKAPKLADIMPLRAAATMLEPPVPGTAGMRTSAPPPPSIGTMPCCWPIGDPGTPDFRFCEARAVAGRPYCPQHCAQAYVTRRQSTAGEASESGTGAGDCNGRALPKRRAAR